MKHSKGFTIVELVIIIAVIGILAAVLVPTFVTVVRKQNIAYDTTLVDNINTVLTSVFTFDSSLSVTDTKKKLADNGVLSLSTKHKKDIIALDLKRNKVVLWDDLSFLKQDGETLVNSVLCEPERLFKDYVILSEGGNPLSEALSAVRSLSLGTDLNKEVFAKTDDIQQEYGLSGITDLIRTFLTASFFIAENGVCLVVNPSTYTVERADLVDYSFSGIANICFTRSANKLLNSTLAYTSAVSAVFIPHTLNEIQGNVFAHTDLVYYSTSVFLPSALKAQAVAAIEATNAVLLKTVNGYGAQVTQTVEVPLATRDLQYNAQIQNGYAPNNAVIVRNGSGSAVNAGNYTAELELKAGYTWADGTMGIKYLPWSIAKAVPVLVQAPNALPVAEGQPFSSAAISGTLPIGVGTPPVTVEGVFAWQNPDTIVTAENNGVYFPAVFYPTDSTNYENLYYRVMVLVE